MNVLLTPSPALLIPVGVAALLLAVLVIRPSITRSIEGKILAVVALFVAPALAVYGGIAEHVERQTTTSYCVSCHAMKAYGESLRSEDPSSLAAAHVQNGQVPRERACIACHSDYGMSGTTRAKARSVKYAARNYFGSIPEKIKLVRRYRNRDCLACHAGARSFERAPAHQAEPASIAAMKGGKVSCLRSGCHDLAHAQNAAANDSTSVTAAAPRETSP